jgi:hypothetical protein
MRRGWRPCPRGTGEEADPDQERLGDLLHGLPLLPHGDGQGGDADGSAPEVPAQHLDDGAVEGVEPQLVDLVQLEAAAGHVVGDHAVGLDLGVVADPAEQPVGDARRAARPRGDLRGALVGQVDAEQAGRAVHDAVEVGGLVVLQPGGEPEPVAQRARQQPGAGGGADERERRDLERDRRGTGPLPMTTSTRKSSIAM